MSLSNKLSYAAASLSSYQVRINQATGAVESFYSKMNKLKTQDNYGGEPQRALKYSYESILRTLEQQKIEVGD